MIGNFQKDIFLRKEKEKKKKRVVARNIRALEMNLKKLVSEEIVRYLTSGGWCIINFVSWPLLSVT